METIKNYLESMFRSLPQTEKVLKAKSELFQMMEDKYTELIREGKSENEAVGTVISEFGNLDELAEDLGITNELNTKKQSKTTSRKVTFDEVKGFIEWRKHVPVIRGIGIALCICCVCPPIISDALWQNDVLGPIGMFLMIAAGVALIIFSNSKADDWRFLKAQACQIDQPTIEYIQNQKHNFSTTYSVLISTAIFCFIGWLVPLIAIDEFSSSKIQDISAIFLFIFVAAGVYLIVYANTIKGMYDFLLRLNSRASDPYFAGRFATGEAAEDSFSVDENARVISKIKNPKLRAFLSVYWLIITCIYLSWSFLTFHWHRTWIIWPIAGVVYLLIQSLAEKEE